MRGIFRSRGIRLNKNSDVMSASSKIYYDADFTLLKQPELKRYIDDDILSYFEYSVDEKGNIDTFNFHLNFDNVCSSLYEDLPAEVLNIMDYMPDIFDKTFLNYTIGYRLNNNSIIDKTFYFYPTIQKENRIGLKGITDKDVIKKYIDNLIKYLGINVEAKVEIQDYACLMYKFKGIGISVFRNNKIDYKIYGKIYSNDVYEYLSDKILYVSEQSDKYGEVILTSQRISSKSVTGYNLYYSR